MSSSVDLRDRYNKAVSSFEKRDDYKPHGPSQWIQFIARFKFPEDHSTIFFSDTLNALLTTVTTDLKSLNDPLIFLMELLQVRSFGSARSSCFHPASFLKNAEDNEYPPGCPPSFEIFLSRTDPTKTKGSCGCITVVNNERGFKRSDVWNLCDAGASFKKAAKEESDAAGFIGEKGLGFKTTFRLSDDPHIFSNGFNFKLSSKGKIGYIVPHVLGDPALLKEMSNAADGRTTVIMLPLNKTSYKEIEDNLTTFARSPMVILFLKKMSFIRVHIERNDNIWDNIFIERHEERNPYVRTVKTLRRQSRGDADKSERPIDRLSAEQVGMVECVRSKLNCDRRLALACLKKGKWNIDVASNLRDEVAREQSKNDLNSNSEEQKHAFFVHRREIIKPDSVKRPADDYRVKNAKKREVAVALPLMEKLPEDWTPGYSTLCAYLPTNIQTGWKFIVNADFCLVASREGLSEYSDDLSKTGHWNSWLLSEVASTFVGAFEELQLAAINASYVTRATKQNAFSVVPSASRVGHFKNIFSDIHDQLRTREIFLAQGCPDDRAMPPGKVRFAGQLCLDAEIVFPGHSVLAVDAVLERRHRKLLEALGVKPMLPGEWFNLVKQNPAWIAGLSDEDLMAILSTMAQYPADATVSYFSELVFLPMQNGKLTKPSMASFLANADGAREEIRRSLTHLLDEPEGRSAKDLLITLGVKTSDSKGVARELRSQLMKAHKDKTASVADYVDTFRNMLGFAMLSMSDLTDIMSSLPFVTWSSEFLTMADLTHEGVTKPVWMPRDSDASLQVLVHKPADWPGLILLHDRYNQALEGGKSFMTKSNPNPAVVILQAMKIKSLCRPVGPGRVEMPFVLLKKGEAMPMNLHTEQFINFGPNFTVKTKKWDQGGVLKTFPAPAFLLTRTVPPEWIGPAIVADDHLQAASSRAEAFMIFLERRSAYYASLPGKITKTSAKEFEPYQQHIIGKAETTLTESAFCVGTKKAAWVCVAIPDPAPFDTVKHVMLPPELVFDLTLAPRDIGVPVVPIDLVKMPDGNEDPSIVRDYVHQKFNGLFLPLEPKGVVDWIESVANASTIAHRVKQILLRPDQMAKAYKYLLEVGKILLVKRVVVKEEMVPIDCLIWMNLPFALPGSTVVALADVYPIEMKDIFVKELGVPERLHAKLAMQLWREDVAQRGAAAAAAGAPGGTPASTGKKGAASREAELLAKGTFFLSSIADGAHLFQASDIESMPLLNAMHEARSGVCLLADTMLLYNRLAKVCPVLAFLPPQVGAQATERARFLKLYAQRKLLCNASTAVEFTLKSVPPLQSVPPGASNFWGVEYSFRVVEALNIVCQQNPSRRQLAAMVEDDFDILGLIRIALTKSSQIELNYEFAKKGITGECTSDSFLDGSDGVLYLKGGAGRPKSLTQLQWDTVAREIGARFHLTDEEVVSTLQPAIKLGDADWKQLVSETWPSITPVPGETVMRVKTILQGAEREAEEAEEAEEEEEEEQEGSKKSSAKSIKTERRTDLEEEDEEVRATPTGKKRAAAAAATPAAPSPSKRGAADSAAKKSAEKAAAAERAAAAAPASGSKKSARAEATEPAKKKAKESLAPVVLKQEKRVARVAKSGAASKIGEAIDGETDKPMRKRTEGGRTKKNSSRSSKKAKVQDEEDDEVPVHEPENWDESVTFSSIVRFEDSESLRHSNRVNPNVRIGLLPREHVAYRPRGVSRGVFAARDLAAGRVIGIHTGLVRWANGDENEVVSDYFMSYGQTNTDVAIYDVESEKFGNELRFLNSSHNMTMPSNVRVEGRVIDILFVNLPCVIAARDIKAGEELLLDYVADASL